MCDLTDGHDVIEEQKEFKRNGRFPCAAAVSCEIFSPKKTFKQVLHYSFRKLLCIYFAPWKVQLPEL